MGKYWLHDAVVPLQKALGDKLYLYPGYELRSRSSAGFDDIRGIVMHHDADPPTGNDMDAVRYCAERAIDKPVGNFHVMRSGVVAFHTAGASNHAGKGGPVQTSKGTVLLDQGNRYLIGIEASNNGIGEAWNDNQLDSYITLVATLCKVYGLDPLKDVYGHADWCAPSCPGRKVDPRGPTPKYPKFGGETGLRTWNINEVRKQIKAVLTTTVPPVGNDWEALGATYPTPPGDPVLELGVVHPNVKWLHAVLCSMDTPDGQPLYNPAWVDTNEFNEATKNSIVYFQNQHKLTPDGVYGTVTANKMLVVRGK